MTKRKSRRRAVNVFDRAGPTPETLAKLVRDDWRLSLNTDQQLAASKIMAAYQILTQGVGVKIADLTRTDPVTTHENPGEEALERNYRRWWHACSGRGLHILKVHGVLVDPLAVAVMGSLNGNPQRFIVSQDTGARVEIGYVEACLDEYVKIGGGKVLDRNTSAA